MNGNRMIKTLTIKEAAENLDKWAILPPRLNSYTKKKECPVVFDGELVTIQIGTKKQPVHCPFGLSRWNQSENKYTSVKSCTDTAWAYAAAQASDFERKTPGGKLNSQLTLYDQDTEGTQGNYGWRWINGLVDRIVDGLANGVEDKENLDENGKPKITMAVDQSSLPDEEDKRKDLLKHMLVPPFRHTNPEYAPSLNCKVRYSVVKCADSGTPVITLNQAEIYNNFSAEPVKPGTELDIFTEKCRGVWMLKVNPLSFKRNEINLTIDIVKAVIFPKVSLYRETAFREDDDEDSAMDGTD